MKRARWLVLILLLAFAVPPGGPLAAQGAEPSDDEVNAIAKELYCPVCENVPLDVCGTQACAQWRATIREKLAEGWTDAEIKQYFVDQYGDRVLAAPPARGVNIVFWVLPPIALAAGAFFLLRFFRQQGAAQPVGTRPAPEPAADDEYVARLERDLAERR